MAIGAKATRLGPGMTTLARQAEAAGERLQTLAGQLRDVLPANGAAALSEGLASARGYLGERELGDMASDALELVRRHPVQAMLVAAGAAWTLSWLGRRPRSTNGFQTRVKDVMTRHVEVVRPDAPLKEAAAKMADLDVGAIPVCDGERLVGMLTDRDITVRAVARGADPGTTPVRDVMTASVRFVYEDEPVERAVEMMKSHKIRRLPIIDAGRHLAGIISLGDLAVDADVEEAGRALERISSPARPTR